MDRRLYWSIVVIAFLFLIDNIQSKADLDCDSKGKSKNYLDVAMDMITRARDNLPTCKESNASVSSMDCSDILKAGYNKSGAYKVWPKSRVIGDKPVEVYCDMNTDGGGWTVIQRRGNYARPKDYFFKDWASYKSGFGDIQRDFWLGNENIFALTNQRLYSIRFDLQDVQKEKRYALYDSFWIDGESSKYTLHIDDYSGNAGDSMSDGNKQKFTTKDQDNDSTGTENCAERYKGGWWYNACHKANLNGLDLRGKHDSFADGIEWNTWRGYHESLDTTEMKIRPKGFQNAPTDHEFLTPKF